MQYITRGIPWTEAQTQEFIVRQMRFFSERGFCLWKLVLKSTGTISGFCGIQDLEGTNETEIGWWLAWEHWGKGIATEAARRVLTDAFSRAKLRRIVAIARPENAASRRVMEKIGMVYERDYVHRGIPIVLYAISPIQWAKIGKVNF